MDCACGRASSERPLPPMPAYIAEGGDRYYRTPIYVREIAHRRAARKRDIKAI
jgi:hypothetical protein